MPGGPAGEPAGLPSTIVVGYDGSESARRALGRVAALAAPGAQVVVVAAIAPYPGSGVTIPVNERPAEIHRRRQDLDEARALLAEDADLVVVGTRSLSRLHSLLLGWVSSKVVSGAPCDVLVLR